MSGYELVLGAILLVSALYLWGLSQTGSAGPRKPRKDRPDIAYQPYTREFDCACNGAELEGILKAQAVNMRPSANSKLGTLDDRHQAFDSGHKDAKASCAGMDGSDLSDAAICILIDQSGSMAERLPYVGGQVLGASQAFEARGAKVMVAAFTTAGWKGGKSRIKWSRAGAPEYPGRLCDLLHITYSDFADGAVRSDFDGMLGPSVCFENVDGEALIWANECLNTVKAKRRILLIVSDGAPVDDSTLSANGPAVLERHIKDTINEIEVAGDTALGAVGIGYDVERYYSVSDWVSGDGEVAAAIWSVTDQLAS